MNLTNQINQKETKVEVGPRLLIDAGDILLVVMIIIEENPMTIERDQINTIESIIAHQVVQLNRKKILLNL